MSKSGAVHVLVSFIFVIFKFLATFRYFRILRFSFQFLHLFEEWKIGSCMLI